MAETTVSFSSEDKDIFDPQAAIIVAAIDFGTTYSGYGFSFKTSPNDIIANKNWGSEVGAASFKTPTSVLVDSNKKFKAFGYEAEHEYGQLCSTGKGDQYDLFRHFKMMLYHEKKLTRSTKIKSTRGNNGCGIDIFAMALQYLKDHLLNTVDQQVSSTPDPNSIHWVLTIPAIWNDRAKQFMREAAYQAGLIRTKNSKQLMFALEPEAASVLCRSLEVNHFTEVPVMTMDVNFPTGTKYMIIDAGGGTIDITAHEILEDGNMVELLCPTGGSWGGNQVDKNFEGLLCRVLGEHFIDVYKRDCPSEWLDLITEFEKKKRATNISQDSPMRIPLLWSISEKYKNVTGNNIQTVLEAASDKGISFLQGNMVINAATVATLFEPVIENIVNHVRERIQHDRFQNLQYMLLVGGFGESKYLFQSMKDEFSNRCTVISPHSASLAIIKGAVLFGHKPQVITARRARKTYGQSIRVVFKEGVHDPSKLVYNEEGHKRCEQIFRVYITKDELVAINSYKCFLQIPSCSKSTEDCSKFFCTDKKNVTYVDEPGVYKIGTLTIEIPLVPSQSRKERIIETRVYFGHTEIEIEMEDKSRKNGMIGRTSIDCLADG